MQRSTAERCGTSTTRVCQGIYLPRRTKPLGDGRCGRYASSQCRQKHVMAHVRRDAVLTQGSGGLIGSNRTEQASVTLGAVEARRQQHDVRIERSQRREQPAVPAAASYSHVSTSLPNPITLLTAEANERARLRSERKRCDSAHATVQHRSFPTVHFCSTCAPLQCTPHDDWLR